MLWNICETTLFLFSRIAACRPEKPQRSSNSFCPEDVGKREATADHYKALTLETHSISLLKTVPH